MATSTQIPLEVYMLTGYQPDREYIDGELREKDMGKWGRGRFQVVLAMWFGRHESLWNVMGSMEQRIQVSASRVRLPI